MPIVILTYLRNYIKTLTRLLTIPRFWGPLATIWFTLVYHVIADHFGIFISVGWLWLFMIVGAFIGGLRAAILCAIWISFYAAFLMPADPSLTIQRVIISFAMAVLVGYLRRRERNLQQAVMVAFSNGNVAKIRDALAQATTLKLNLKTTADTTVETTLEQIESDLGNTLAVLDGYKFLRDEIERVNKWYAEPGNAERLQKMRETE